MEAGSRRRTIGKWGNSGLDSFLLCRDNNAAAAARRMSDRRKLLSQIAYSGSQGPHSRKVSGNRTLKSLILSCRLGTPLITRRRRSSSSSSISIQGPKDPIGNYTARRRRRHSAVTASGTAREAPLNLNSLSPTTTPPPAPRCISYNFFFISVRSPSSFKHCIGLISKCNGGIRALGNTIEIGPRLQSVKRPI